VAEQPTWRGQPVASEDIITVAREAFDIVLNMMTGTGVLHHTKDELLNLLEAGAYLDLMGAYANELALQLAREAGASWGELATATGTTRSIAKTRYERLTRDVEAEERRRMWELIESSGPLASIVDVRPVVYAAAESEGWSFSEGPSESGGEDFRVTIFEREPDQKICVTWNKFGEIAEGGMGVGDSALSRALGTAINQTGDRQRELKAAMTKQATGRTRKTN
jgi:hypothetical protein